MTDAEDGGFGPALGRFIQDVAPPTVCVAVSVFLLTVAAQADWSDLWVIIAAGVLAASVWYLSHVLGRQRNQPGPFTDLLRFLTSMSLLVLGGIGVAVWLVGDPIDGVGFGGFLIFSLAFGQLMADLRHSRRWAGRRGPVLLVSGFAVVMIGLFAVSSSDYEAALAITGLGLLVMYFGYITASEDVLRGHQDGPIATSGHPRMWTLATVVAGAVILSVAALFIWQDWFSTTVTVLVFVVPVVAAAAMASNSDADIFLVVVFVAIVWSFAPDTVAEPDSVKPVDDAIVVFGDSYMSGEGAAEFFADTNTRSSFDEGDENQCRRAPGAYPVLIAERTVGSVPDEFPESVFFVACSGARAADIDQRPQYPGEPVEGPEGGLSQLENWRQRGAGLDPAFVLVSIGGNDAGFADLVQTCLAPGDCASIGEVWLDELPEVDRKVERVYRELREEFRSVPVIAVPYPIPIRETNAGCSSSPLTEREHQFLHGFTEQLNDVVSAAATRAGVHVLHTMPNSLKNAELRICDRPLDEIGVNFLVANPVSGSLEDRLSPLNWLHNSMHPNPLGHEQLARTASKWLSDRPDLAAAPPVPEAPHEVETMDEVMGEGVEHCGDSESSQQHCDLVEVDEADDQIDASAWLWAELVQGLRIAVPLGITALLGAWLIVIEPLAWARRKGIAAGSLFSWVRRLGQRIW